MNPYRVMDKQVARYAHLQNPDTIEIWYGGVLPETFYSLIIENGVYYNPYFTINNPDTEGGITSADFSRSALTKI